MPDPLKRVLSVLEPCAGKLASTVLRGGSHRKVIALLDLPLQLAVIEDMDHSHLNAEQLALRDRHPVPFHVIINPRLYIEEFAGDAEFFEGCISVPELVGIVPRAKSVRVECLNEHGEPVVIQAQGWYARILQHEIDHLNGILYIDKAQLPTLMTTENYIKLYKDKSVQEIHAALFLNNAIRETANVADVK